MSPTYVAGLVALIVSLLEFFKIKVLPAEIEPIIIGIAAIIVLFRRYKQGDLTIFGSKKK